MGREARTIEQAAAPAASVESATQPLVALTTLKRGQGGLATATHWLRANYISAAFFVLAAGAASKVTIEVLHPERPESDAVGGYGVALIFYIIAACNLRNDKARRVARTLPFGVGLLCSSGYILWLIFLTKNPEYEGIIGAAAVGAIILGSLSQMSWGIGIADTGARQIAVTEQQADTARKTRAAIDAQPPLTRMKSPADIWATNEGIYLGLTPQGGTDQRRPLAGKEDEPSRPREAQYRSTWEPEPDGEMNLFDGEGHVAMFGPQGIGKTRKILLPNLYKLRDWSCVVIDTKGALCAYTAVHRASKGQKVFVIDPFKIIETKYPRLFARYPKLFKSCGYNPLAALPESPTLIDDAKAMAMALIQSDDARDPYWPMAAQALIKGLTMVSRIDKPGTSDSLVALRTYLGHTPKDFATLIEADIKKYGEKWPAIAASLGEFAAYEAGDKEIGGIRRTAKAQTDWLDSPMIRDDLGQKNVIDFETFKTTPSTCYLILPPDQLETHGPWLRMMVTAALRPLLRSTGSAVPCLFMLDEAPALGHMKIIESNIGQMREFGVKLFTVWQDLPQLQRTYKQSWQTFMSTAEEKITFTINEVETREYFSKLSGERLYRHYMHSRSRNTSTNVALGQGGNLLQNILHNLTNENVSNSDSMNETQQNERIIKPYEIAALDADEAVIFSPRGRMRRSICPQPEELRGVVADSIREMQAIITGTGTGTRELSA